MDRSTATEEYRFNEKGHLHELLVDGEWKALTGCTTILAVLAKPALIQWSANMAVEYIKDELYEKSLMPPKNMLDGIFERAKSAHRKKKEEAGQKGTDIHFEAENLVKGAIQANKGIIGTDTKSEIPQIQHFINWAVENKVKFLKTEKGLYSKSLFIGGIVDLICEIDGEVWLADIKTGSGIYAEAFWQMAGYQLMLEEMGTKKPVKGHIVLNLKKDGKFEEKRSVSNEDARKGFLACLEIYRVQEKFKNNIT